jgi:predicted RecA/RadA family phage recombinase
MNASFARQGKRIDHTPVADVAFGDTVVIGDFVAVADQPIAAGKDGSLALEGVYNVDKAAVAITKGAKVYFDETAENYTTVSEGNKAAGHAFKAAAEADAQMQVRLWQF